MGKQSRRKRLRSKRPSSHPSTGSSTTATRQQESTLLRNLRHADSRTRHASLVALNATLLDPEELMRQASSSKSRRIVISSPLLEATRERVMDDDLECAQVAAGCCANYVSFGTTARHYNMDELTAGWTRIFLQRLKQCLTEVTFTNTRTQWLALAVQCLHALCALVETNPMALDRLTSEEQASTTTTTTTTMDFLSTMLGLLRMGQLFLSSASSSTTKSDKEQEYIQDIMVYAARTLYSALDENVDLLRTWLITAAESSSTTTVLAITDGWTMLQACCKMSSLPLACRLHAAGCLVTARQLSMLFQKDDSTTHCSITCIPMFHQLQVLETVLFLLYEHVEIPSTLLETLVKNYRHAQDALEQQEADDVMEREVIQTVQEKSEPAKLIARRQKELKQKQREEQASNQTQKDDSVDMEQDNDDDDTSAVQRVDAREVLEEAHKAWHSTIFPLQLTLELVANVTSVSSAVGRDQEDEDEKEQDMAMEQDDDMLWGPEQEAELMASALQSASTNSDGNVACPRDTELLDALAQSGLADRLVLLLKALCTHVGVDHESLPATVKSDLQDLQSKCAACLCNVIGNLEKWQLPRDFWKELQSAAHSSTGGGKEGVFDCMVVAIRTRPELRKQIQADDVELLMAELSSTSTASDGIKGDVINILGVLCSTESHPDAVNEKVCSGFLSLLQSSSSPMIMSEVFNALMDMYGDDGHTLVFDSLDVLGNFQRMLPRFRTRIQAQRNKADEQDVEQWRETALNASRFISYKKGQL